MLKELGEEAWRRKSDWRKLRKLEMMGLWRMKRTDSGVESPCAVVAS